MNLLPQAERLDLIGYFRAVTAPPVRRFDFAPGILAPLMPAFYRASVAEFIHTSDSEITGRLASAYAHSGFSSQRTSQTRAWEADLASLRSAFDVVVAQNSRAMTWALLLEFPIPRKEKRIDVVLLAGATIVILELKTSTQGADADRQAEEYALLLHFFHRPSNRRKIVTYVVAPTARARSREAQNFLPIEEAPAYWVPRVQQISWADLPKCLAALASEEHELCIDSVVWDNGEYRPVPSIIEAAVSLQSGLETIREIAHSLATRHDVDRLTCFVTNVIAEARKNGSFVICFVTGVPGSGKTLVGLNLAYGIKPGQDHIAFMSGTGPLVKVLQAALASEHRFRMKVKSEEAMRKAKTLIENVHVFAKYYAEENPDRAPADHTIIFDEAQRAWDRAQNSRKFKRDYSEPDMLLKIMERHEDWAVVIALVGGGQEINDGEAGLSEWGRALTASARKWSVYASPEAITGGEAVAGSKLFAQGYEHTASVHAETQLHLDVSVRSLKAASYSEWVNCVVNGEVSRAAAIADKAKKDRDSFPTFLTRSLDDARELLKHNTLGERRCGLVGSSGATRLRAEGLEPDPTFHNEYPWNHWYLAGPRDVRSSHQLEVFATEFEIQGLELDWVGLCWGGDLIWSPSQTKWLTRKFSKAVSKWSSIKQESQQTFRRNAYRVLLTRARQGIVIYVPAGDSRDPTRNPTEFDDTANLLVECGAQLAVPFRKDAPVHKPRTSLFD
jgi:hypothetical protein